MDFVLEVRISNHGYMQPASQVCCCGEAVAVFHISASGEELCVSKRCSRIVLTLKRKLVTSFVDCVPKLMNVERKLLLFQQMFVACFTSRPGTQSIIKA